MAGNANSGKRAEAKFYNALDMALKDHKDGPDVRLRKIANNLVKAAEESEQWAIKEVADRLDGKPSQTTDLNLNDNRSLAEYTREELYSILDSRRSGGGGADSETGRGAKPDSVH